MAFSPFSPPPGSRAPSTSAHSAYFTAQDIHSPSPSLFSAAATADAFSASSPEDRFNNAFAPQHGGGPSNTSFGSVGGARPYPLVEQRSFRDASLAGDVVVTRDELTPGHAVGGIGMARKPSTGSVGAIGDGRRLSPSPTPGLRREEEALGIPAGIFDGHGALVAPSGDDSRAPSENGGKSRPSSFILDVLPQTRERGSAGPPTPSLSLDSVSQPPFSSSTADFNPLPSPHSLAPIAPTSFLNSSTASLPLSPSISAGGNVLSSSRTSSPGPLDSTTSSSVPSVESLAAKVNNLETTVSDLSSLLASEFRNLREEVGLLRTLVVQQQQANTAGAARQAFERAQERETDSPVLTLRSPSPKHPSLSASQPIPTSRSYFNNSASSLVAQPATSPGHNGPGPVSPGGAGGFFGLQQQQQQQQQHRGASHFEQSERLRSHSDDSAASSSLKDEQIKLLTAQVSSLSTTVSQLLANPTVAAAASVNPAVVAAAAAAGLGGNNPSPAPSPMLGGGGAGPSAPPMAARSMSQQQQLSLGLVNGMGVGGMNGQPTGLGVSTPNGMLSPSLGGPVAVMQVQQNGGGVGVNGLGMGVGRSPMVRQVSSGGIARSGSMRSASGAGVGSFDSLPSNSAWDGGMSSPMLGGPPSGVNSPMLSAGGGGGGNPPGSLGSKWEALGVGQDLFRAIAKYGLGPPTKIQGKAIPCVVRGQDAVAQAPAIQERIQCYVIPVLQTLYTHQSLAAQQAALDSSSASASTRGIQAVVVTATVDQAAQAQRLAVGLGGALGIRTSLCTGQGGDIQSELQTLLKSPPHILVGTPHKLLALFEQRQLPMNDIRLLVIDECDQLIARNLSDLVLNLARLFPPTVTVPAGSIGGGPASGGGAGANGSTSPIMTRSPLPGAFDSPGFAPMARFGSNQGAPSGGGASNGNGSIHAGSSAPTSTERQMAVFSCTVPQDVLNFATSLQLKEPVKVLVRRENADGGGGGGGGGAGGGGGGSTMRGIKQYYLYLAMGGNPGSKSKTIGAGRREAGPAREWKLEALADLVEDASQEHVIVFASSVEGVEAISYKLGTRAIEALALHQDMGQPARQQIFTKFRSQAPSRPGVSSKRVLVVYDALARSLTAVPSGEGVTPVPLVINFDMPRAVEEYAPRIACVGSTPGTTGGGGRGTVINIVVPNEVDMIRGIESFFRCKIGELPPNFATN